MCDVMYSEKQKQKSEKENELIVNRFSDKQIVPNIQSSVEVKINENTCVLQKGVIPSLDANPGIKQSPILSDFKEGNMEGVILTPELRSLNRFARANWAIMMNKENKKKMTPHLAMMVWNEKIYVAGNTDRNVPDKILKINLLKGLDDLIKENSVDVDILEKRKRMFRKLSKIKKQEYHTEFNQDDIMVAIREAIEQPNEKIEIIREEGKNKSYMHGEMLILDKLYKDYLDNNNEDLCDGGDKKSVPGQLKDVFMGGNLQDCIFCHWAFAIFNEYIGKEIGIRVVSSGTHGNMPLKWRVPMWMQEKEGAYNIMKNKINKLESDNVKYTFNKDFISGKAKTTSHQMTDTMLEASDDSDVE